MNLGNSGGNSAAVLDSHQLAAAAAVAAAAHDDKETALLSEEEQELLLTKTNKLLAAVGLSAKGKYIHSTEELSRVASSLFVAIFESLFKMHISGIVRCPKSPTDYVTNAQLVIDRLSEQIQVDLKHITGDSIVNGDLRVLSNMVNILLRIVSLTRILYVVKIQHILMERSVTTHESTFQERDLGDRISPSFVDYNAFETKKDSNRGRGSAELDEMLQKSVEKAEEKLRMERKIESGRMRKQNALRAQEMRARAANLRQKETTRKAMQQRWKKEQQAEQKSLAMRETSEELSLLRKVYKSLLKNELRLRIEEGKEDKTRRLQVREQARWHIESLQTLFEERLKILLPDEHQQGVTRRNERLLRNERRVADELIRSIDQRHASLLEQERCNLKQHQQKKLLRKRDAYQDLLVMLSTSDWQEMLRNEYEAIISAIVDLVASS